MKFSLIICTYQRPASVIRLLESIQEQKLIPAEILIIDGSIDDKTEKALNAVRLQNLNYFRVGKEGRGLTKQRNFGINKISEDTEIVCFLDDDVILEDDYFYELISTYDKIPDALGVGGYIINEAPWKKTKSPPQFGEFEYDDWIRKLGDRNVLRKKLGLLSKLPPGFMPDFSNGFSTGFLPPSGKVYPVEFFMGVVASYRKKLFDKISFSNYFEGYGLYEDMDFCLRASRLGQLYVNTAAGLYHYHEEGGRPNRYNYGKMVTRNGWYVWRVKNPDPSIKVKVKWHAIALLLIAVRLTNILNTSKRKEAFTESLGRFVGWSMLFWKKPTNA